MCVYSVSVCIFVCVCVNVLSQSVYVQVCKSVRVCECGGCENVRVRVLMTEWVSIRLSVVRV